jgi:membrane protease YdiL (CAAX protease family)
MNTSPSLKRSPLTFFVLVFALSLPFWALGAVAEPLPPPINLSLSSFFFVCPLIAAFILTYTEEKIGGIRGLLKRVFDFKRIRRKIWYVPIILLLPSIYLLSYVVMLLLGLPLPANIIIPFPLVPLIIVVFFLLAVGEETGWTGYVTGPMQDRWSVLTTSILLGLVWGIWHIVPDIESHRTLAFIAGQRFFHSVALRILIVWLYNITGKSLFAVILFHAMDNVCFSLFPNYGSNYDPAITGAITAITAVIVTFLWGSKTLAWYRYAVRL